MYGVSVTLDNDSALQQEMDVPGHEMLSRSTVVRIPTLAKWITVVGSRDVDDGENRDFALLEILSKAYHSQLSSHINVFDSRSYTL